MALKAINDWLNGSRNYNQGVSLFAEHGESQMFKDLFASSQNPYTETKLVEMLTAINVASAPPDLLPTGDTTKRKPTELKAFQPKQEHSFEPVDLTKAPKALQSLDNRRKQLFQQAATEKERLSSSYYTNAAERFEALKIIHDNFYGTKGIQAIWKRIDHWQKFKRFVPFDAAPAKENQTREELILKRNKLRTYVSKYKNKEAKLHLFNRYAQELTDVEQKLMDNAKE